MRFDAGVAAGIALGVLQSDLVNVAGVAPIILYLADRREVTTDQRSGLLAAGRLGGDVSASARRPYSCGYSPHCDTQRARRLDYRAGAVRKHGVW